MSWYRGIHDMDPFWDSFIDQDNIENKKEINMKSFFKSALSIFLLLTVFFAISIANAPCNSRVSIHQDMDWDLPIWSQNYTPCADSLEWSLTFTIAEAEEWGAISALIIGTDVFVDVYSFNYDVGQTYTLTGVGYNTGTQNALLLDLVVGPPSGHFKDISFVVSYFNDRNELQKK